MDGCGRGDVAAGYDKETKRRWPTWVLDLETTKTTQAFKIDNLKRRVKKLESKRRSRTYGLKRLYKIGFLARVESSEDKGLDKEDASKHVRIADIDANEDIYLVNVHNDEDMFSVNDLDGDEVIIKNVDVAEQAKEVVDDITFAKSLMEIKIAKSNAVKVVIQEPEQGITTTTPTTITAASSRPKAKGLVIREQEQAPTPIKLKSLKKKSFVEIQELFDKARKKVNTFVDFRTKLVEESLKKAKAEITQEDSLKRAGDELEQERSKKQKVEDNKESEELKKCLEIVLDDGYDVTIDATPLSSKSPTIVDYKIYQEGKKNYFQFFRADGNSQIYLTFSKMLKNFDREDLEVLWRLVKARFKKKMYPLTNHTLHQMFNDVNLQVNYECEMAFELLRLVKKQLKKDMYLNEVFGNILLVINKAFNEET
uniref:Uncharacterized protein n=1 Tax=Tanacetum cinerariifolium TaxID=118510 RepID=A0A6L2MMD9_TANCI|nr:hypothetical protein [Tanacetum cinerariifolium]